MAHDEDPVSDIALIRSKATIRRIIFPKPGDESRARNIDDMVEEKRLILEEYVVTRIREHDIRLKQNQDISCSGCKWDNANEIWSETCQICRRMTRDDKYEKYDLETDFASRCALSLANSPPEDRISIIKDMLISYKAEL